LSFWHENGYGIGFRNDSDKTKKALAKKSLAFNKKNKMFNKLFLNTPIFKTILANMKKGKRTIFKHREKK
jgi:hypothetical protein